MADEETTAEEAAPEATKPAPPEKKLTEAGLADRFLKLSGYKEKDLIGVNTIRKTAATWNGGKYQFTKSGLRTLSGPAYPKEEVEEE